MALNIDEINTATSVTSYLNDYELDALSNEIVKLQDFSRPPIAFGWEKGVTGYLALETNLGEDLLQSIAFIQGIALVGYHAEESFDSRDMYPGRANAVATVEWLLNLATDRAPVIAQVLEGIKQGASRYSADVGNAFANKARNDLTTLDGGIIVIYPGTLDNWRKRVNKWVADLKSIRNRLENLDEDYLVYQAARNKMAASEVDAMIAYAIKVCEDAELPEIRDVVGRDRSTEAFGAEGAKIH